MNIDSKYLLLSYMLIVLILTFDNQKAFAQTIEMLTEWDSALDLAQKENKNILIILTGSEWCAPCKKMDKNVIANPEFQKYAKNELVIFLIDLPGGSLKIDSKVYKDYTHFKEKFQTNALPSLILTEKNGDKIKNLKGKMFDLENVMKQLQTK
ncbi:MAG: thioredoxin family protein [Cyclobacteriaceae bacterium]|nr:thioredoxin family protein [Cyclobacteriaceae bacterium]